MCGTMNHTNQSYRYISSTKLLPLTTFPTCNWYTSPLLLAKPSIDITKVASRETISMQINRLSHRFSPPSRIDFDDPSTTKPPSLAKSAVLAALEEEEREKSRGTGK